MAYSLSLKFALYSGDTRTMNIPSVLDSIIDDSTTDAAAETVQTAADTMIANNPFEDALDSLLYAKLYESNTVTLIDNES